MRKHAEDDFTQATGEPEWGSRREAATVAVQTVLARAEENYLAAPDLGLAIWLARVEETVAVAAHLTVGQIEHRRLLLEEDVAVAEAGVFADICAEAIRAASRLSHDRSPEVAKEEILELVAAADAMAPGPGWDEIQEALLRCQAALEPIARALRDGELAMVAEIDRDHAFGDSLSEVAQISFGVVYALCAYM